MVAYCRTLHTPSGGRGLDKVAAQKQRNDKRAKQPDPADPSRAAPNESDEPDILEGLARDIVSRLATTLFGEDDAGAWERTVEPGAETPGSGLADGVGTVLAEVPLAGAREVAAGARQPADKPSGPMPAQRSEIERQDAEHERAARQLYLRPRPVKSDRPALLVRGTVRSGRQIRHQGDVVVLGDVNPGAQIVAAGDVVVMGTLRGMVHAGATGDHTSVVAAFRLAPTQLRIASYMARPPEEPGPRPDYPEVALVRDGALVVKPLLSGTFPGLGPAAFRLSRR